MPLKQSRKILDIMTAQMAPMNADTPDKDEADLPAENTEKPMGDVSDEIEDFDKEQIKSALTGIEELKEVVNARGDLFMTVNGVRGYKVNLQYADAMPQMPQLNKPDQKKKRLENVCMFIYSEPNSAVIKFLVSTAQSNNLKKILGFTEHAVIVTEYRM